MNHTFTIGNAISWLFGLVVLAIGLINTFWGNDPGYGIFVVLLSSVYFPPATAFFRKISGITIPVIAKFILAIFILWSALGVAELFDKIRLMTNNF
jgi:hypothetical protein